jgi:DnaJ-class molecular chaperone
MTPLEILGLSEDASAQEIELRWRELRSELHPDKGGDAERFHQASEAYAAALTEAQRPKTCPTCHGEKTIGIVRGFNTIKVCCSYCGGTGLQP